MKIMPELNKDLCNRCGLCVIACHGGGIVAVVGGVIAIIPTENCDYCGVCEAVCPTGALTCPYDVTFDASN